MGTRTKAGPCARQFFYIQGTSRSRALQICSNSGFPALSSNQRAGYEHSAIAAAPTCDPADSHGGNPFHLTSANRMRGSTNKSHDGRTDSIAAMLDYGECSEAVPLHLEDEVRVIERQTALKERH